MCGNILPRRHIHLRAEGHTKLELPLLHRFSKDSQQYHHTWLQDGIGSRRRLIENHIIINNKQ